MTQALNSSGLMFPTPYDQWSTDFTNTLSTWIRQVSETLERVTGLEDVDCLSDISNNAGIIQYGFIGGWQITPTAIQASNMCLDNANERISVGNPAGVHLQIDGTNKRIRTSDFASGAMGTGWQVGTDIAEFQNIRARGRFYASVFEKGAVSAVGGSLAILDSDTLAADMTMLDSSCLTISGQTTFQPDDTLRIKTGNDDEWFKVISVVAGNTYCVCRDMASLYEVDCNPLWTKGAAVISYGQAGEGGILLTSQEVCSPYISIFTHTGCAWETLEQKVRIGNLGGVSSSFFGALSGYGFWSENGYFEGRIVSSSAKFVDPACDENYSCLDSGALKFHDKLGDVPYVKRICAGVGSAGQVVVLNGWTTMPQVVVSPNSLISYNSTVGGCQSLAVSASQPEWYCTSPACYGYCFTLYGNLQISGSQCTVCIHNAAFDTCVVTYGNVQSSLVGMKYQLWTTIGGVGACYCVGCLCYEICYRCLGCASWEGSCSFTYLHPSGSAAAITQDYIPLVCLNFPSCECWELMATEVGSSWVATTIPSGQPVSGFVTRYFGNKLSCLNFCCITNDCYCVTSAGYSLGLGGSNPVGITCNKLYYSWCSNGTGCQHAYYYCTSGCIYNWNCWESYIKVDSGIATSYNACRLGQANLCCSWNQLGCSLTIGHTNNISQIYLCHCLKTCQCGSFGFIDATNEICILGGCLVQCYTTCCATAATCLTMRLNQTCDRLGSACITGSAGELNWLAIAYS